MIVAGDFRNGSTFELDGQVFQVIEFQHVKPGKGAAFVRTKIRNVISGGVVERTFSPTDKMPKAHIERRDMAFSYSDDDLYYFMDQETFDMVPINSSSIADSMKFVKENTVCKVLSFKGTVFGLEPPLSVDLEVIETEPGFKGDTSTGAKKPATVETGVTIMVPLFINQGEIIKIDTRTGDYLSRA